MIDWEWRLLVYTKIHSELVVTSLRQCLEPHVLIGVERTNRKKFAFVANLTFPEVWTEPELVGFSSLNSSIDTPHGLWVDA